MRKVKAVIETCSMILENYIRNVEEFFLEFKKIMVTMMTHSENNSCEEDEGVRF